MQWLQSLSVIPDVVCLQESHCVSVVECRSWFLSSGYSVVSSPGSHKSCGCIILFRPCLSQVSSQSDSSGRFIQCEFAFRDVVFRVVCVYAPNRNPDRDSFLGDISTPRSLRFLLETLTPFSIVQWIVVVLSRPTPPGRALWPLPVYSGTLVV